jgi:hypothetical protein
MKKTIFTLAAVAFLAVAGHAQDKSSKKEKEKTSASTTTEVNPDGTLKQSGEQQAEPRKEQKKGGTRMAINEKGMPGNAGKKEHSSSSSSSSTKKD